MKIWQETAAVLDRLEQIEGRDASAALAVLVAIQGSAYRRPGAKLLVDEDGETLGSISGGCLEEDVRQVALEVMRTGAPQMLHYETGAADESVWGLGLGCDGAVDLFVQPVTNARYRGVASVVRDLLRGNEQFLICTVLDGPCEPGSQVVVGGSEIVAGTSGNRELDELLLTASSSAIESDSSMQTAGEVTLFFEVHLPPPNLLVCGAADDAIPLVRLAADAGFRVLIVDHRPAYLTGERFPTAWRRLHVRAGDGLADLPTGSDTYAVVKTHSLARDTEWIRPLLAMDIRYIGLLGPRGRRDEIVSELRDVDQQRVYGPVGLDLGAEGPEQVALSVVAELLAVRSGREPIHLRDSDRPIHPGN